MKTDTELELLATDLQTLRRFLAKSTFFPVRTERFQTYLAKSFQYKPIKGQPNRFRVRVTNRRASKPEDQVTQQEWDIFEKAIEDAFEIVP